MGMTEMLAMGDYGPFVWSSYLLTLIVVVVSLVQAKRRHRRIEERIRRRLKLEESSE